MDRGNELICHHRMREVQIISILIILNSPENRGLFAQIKTGEGKSTIVSTLAVIKSLELEYVDVLSSSIVLAKRDAEEKKPFYEVFGLTVSSADDENAYLSNVVYGDTLQFEGDILRDEFKRESSSSRAKNRRRNF